MVKDKRKKIIIGVLGIIAVCVAAGYTYMHFQLNKINKVDIPKTNEELNISNTASNLDAAVVNIALFGVDRRSESEIGRSDSIMILSIDKTHNKLKLSSIMRDTYVDVEGHGMNIITHAYVYGGAALAVKTLNTTFDLNIKDYVTVDFFGLEKIIDNVGGIELNITSEEVKYINGTHPIEADLKALTDQLHKFIYEDQKPTPGAY